MKRLLTPATICAVLTIVSTACDPDLPIHGNDKTEPDDTTIVEDLSAYQDLARVTFTESDKVFPNPERGFYFVDDFGSADDKPITSSVLIANRKLNRTIAYHGYYLTDFMESDISAEFIELIRKNMQALRDGGAKCVLRFAYTDFEPTLNDSMPEDFKGRDASVEWVLRHIEQVKPILQEYGDVILCYQAGYVGVWGEWYYTDHFVSGPQTPEEHSLRKSVVDAMLDALPQDRQVALRTPMFKRMMYAEDYTDTLTVETAHNGSDRARIGAFNDCFGASQSDQGTFSGSESREYWKKETRYVFMGGETCALSTYCRCEGSLKDMEDYHWTYLNSEYNSKVLSRWRTDGCMNEIERRLGYRLSLYDAFCSPNAESGEDFRIVLRIKNTGFSSPINPRGFELVLVDGKGVETVYEFEDIDPRFWFAGETVTIDKVIKLPSGASGDCTLYLNLPDPEDTLHDNPLFSIRLANEAVWNEESGYNKVLEFTL